MSPRERATQEVLLMYRRNRPYYAVPVVAMQHVARSLQFILYFQDVWPGETECDYPLMAQIARDYLASMWYRRAYWLESHPVGNARPHTNPPYRRWVFTGTGWPC